MAIGEGRPAWKLVVEALAGYVNGARRPGEGWFDMEGNLDLDKPRKEAKKR